MEFRYQALWTCRKCGAAGLLDQSHRYCPACGTARHHEPAWFPDWNDLLPVESHRFHGVHTPCCAQVWSSRARYCGHCGSALDHSANNEEASFPLESLHEHEDLARAMLGELFSGPSLEDDPLAGEDTRPIGMLAS